MKKETFQAPHRFFIVYPLTSPMDSNPSTVRQKTIDNQAENHRQSDRKPSTIRQKTIDNQTENRRQSGRKPSTIRQKTVDNQAETPNHWVSDPPSDESLSCCRQAEFLMCLELNLLLIWSLTCFNTLFEEDRSCAVRPTVSHFGNANRYGVAASRRCY